MKAEERKHLHQNELAETLTSWWKGDGTVSSTVWVVLGVAVLAGALVYAYFYFSKKGETVQANAWLEYERASDMSQLEQLKDANRGTRVGRAATLQLARVALYEGLDQLGSETRRDAAIAKVEKARDYYAGLIKELNDDPQEQREAMLGTAKAEESLVAVPKADNPQEYRGSLDKALEHYEALANKYPESFQGKHAADRAKEIKENRAAVESFYKDLAKTYAAKPDAPKIDLPKIDMPPKIEPPVKTDPPIKIDPVPRTEAPKTEPAKTEPATPPKIEPPAKTDAPPATPPKIEPPVKKE